MSKKPKKQIKNPYNNGYTHEALHAAHIACDLLDTHVLETRCAEEFPDVKAAIQKAADALYDVYQLIGTKFKDEDLDNKTDYYTAPVRPPLF